MRSGKHLTIADRRVIKFLINSKVKKAIIAKEVGVAKSTISYELKTNLMPDGTYDPDYAQKKYDQKRRRCRKKSKLLKDRKLYEFVVESLQRYWSPEQISGSLVKKYPKKNRYISPEGIYQNIYYGILGKSFIQFLRQNKKRRQKRGQKTGKRVIIKDKKNIKERPEAANNKSRLGDWEGDTIFGKNNNGHLATFADRKSSFLAAALMSNKEAKTLNRSALIAFGDIGNKYIKTIQ